MAKEDSGSDKALAALLEKFTEVQSTIIERLSSSSLGPEQLSAILSKVGAETAAGMQKALRPENEMPPLISVYNPLGDRDNPKAKLKRLTFFCDSREHTSDDGTAEQLTPSEVQAYNELGDAAAAAGGRLDARHGQYVAEIRGYQGRELHVYIKGIEKMDTKSNLPPSLLLLCHELKTGESMQDVNTLLEEVTRLRAELGALRGAGTTPISGGSRSGPLAPVTLTGRGGPLVTDLEATLEETPTATLAGGR